MVQKVKSNLTFKKCYTFPEPLENKIWNLLLEIQKEKNKVIHVLHAPVGVSRIGEGKYFNENIKVTTFDIDPKVNPHILGDIFNLSKNEMIKKQIEYHGFYDVVISDPIWIEDKTCRCKNCGEKTSYKNSKGLQYHKRRYISYEIRDVLKDEGYYIFNGLWNPYVIGFEKNFNVSVGMNYEEFPNLEELTTIETLYQNFSSFRNISLLFVMKKVKGFVKP